MKVLRNNIIVFVLSTIFIFTQSCTLEDDYVPPQSIVTTDSSEYNGTLKVEVYTASGAKDNNAIVYLFANYEDLKNNLALNSIPTNASGVSNFGYLLQGNYYLLAYNKSDVTARDTAVAQVLGKQSITRIMQLKH
ncbi:MAG: hypothetical protein IT246_00315 [Bacteroidia bacterium]|nr:hypothetical protein [Bacteroidia bacterium]